MKPQFSIRLLLSIMVVSGFVAFYLKHRLDCSRKWVAIASIESRWPKTLRMHPHGLLKKSFCERVFGIDVFKNETIDAVLVSPHENDLLLREIIKVHSVRNIDIIDGTGVSDSDIAQLSGLSHLESLFIIDQTISGVGLGKLNKLENLKSVRLLSCRMLTSDGVSAISELPHVTSLVLQNTSLRDAHLESFSHNSKITVLNISSTAVSDDGVEFLNAMPRLEVLNISRTKITDKGLRLLAGCKALRWLATNESLVTEEGLSEFRKLRPDVVLNDTRYPHL